jgi:hypothetical protein
MDVCFCLLVLYVVGLSNVVSATGNGIAPSDVWEDRATVCGADVEVERLRSDRITHGAHGPWIGGRGHVTRRTPDRRGDSLLDEPPLLSSFYPTPLANSGTGTLHDRSSIFDSTIENIHGHVSTWVLF